MWNADKIVYRNDDSFVRAYQGSELVWEKIPNNTIYYNIKNVYFTSVYIIFL